MDCTIIRVVRFALDTFLTVFSTFFFILSCFKRRKLFLLYFESMSLMLSSLLMGQKTLLSTEKNLYIIAGVAKLNYCNRYKLKEAKAKDNAKEINWTDFILPNSKPQRPDSLLSKVGSHFLLKKVSTPLSIVLILI